MIFATLVCGPGVCSGFAPKSLRAPYVISFFLRPVFFKVRIKLLYMVMNIPCPPKRDLKQAAKNTKKCLVLIKQKLQRGQVCRSFPFRKLMALVCDPEEHEDKHLSKLVQSSVFLLVPH